MFSVLCFSQDINGGFEEWKASGQPAPFNWFEPKGWGTSNPRTEVTLAGVRKSSDKRSGTLAAEINTVNVFGELTPTAMSLGHLKIDWNKYKDFIYSGGMKLSKLPTSIKFWYKYKSDGANDQGLVRVFLKRYNKVSKTSTLIFQDSLILDKEAVFTEQKINVNTNDFNMESDSFGIIFLSGIEGKIKGKGQLVIDDLALEDINRVENTELKRPLLFPNPVLENSYFYIKINTNKTYTRFDFALSSLNGTHSNFDVEIIDDGLYRILPQSLPIGTYVLSTKDALHSEIISIVKN